MLTAEYRSVLMDYVIPDFPALAGAVAFRTFDPPFVDWNNSSDYKIIHEYGDRVEKDCREQLDLTDGTRSYHLDNLFHSGLIFSGAVAKLTFLQGALSFSPSACVIFSPSADGGMGLFEPAPMIASDAFYITQWYSGTPADKKLGCLNGRSTTIEETATSHAILDYVAGAHELAHILLNREGNKGKHSETVCDIFSFAAAEAEFGQASERILVSIAEQRALNAKVDPEHLTAHGLYAYLNDDTRRNATSGEALWLAKEIACAMP